jgi:hypothetical protein
MHKQILAGSAFVLAIFALGSTPAAACGWGGCGCGAYGYGGNYGASSYAYYAPPSYYARPAYAYAPPAYYAPPSAYAPPIYYGPPVYYAGPTVASYLPPGNYAPPGYYSPPTFGIPYSQRYDGARGGYVAAAHPNRPRGPVPAAIPGARGNYPFAAKDGPRVNKPPMPNYRAPGISASATGVGRKGNNVPPAPYYSGRPNYVPTAYYGGPGGYSGWRQ